MGTILVTGGASLVGRSLLERLETKKDKIITILKPERENLELPSGVSAFYTDIRDTQYLETIFYIQSPTKVVHLAAKSNVRESVEDPLSYEENNTRVTLSLLGLCKKYSVKNFVFTSTAQVYDDDSIPPFLEDKSPADKQKSPYAVSKRSCELYCYNYSNISNMEIVCLRLFNVYGPGMRQYLAISQLVEKALKNETFGMYGDGTNSRDYVYVSDVASSIIKSLSLDSKFEIINIGSSKSTTLSELIELVEKVTGKKIKIERGESHTVEAKDLYADVTKARTLLKWEPEVSLEEGIKKYVKWYKSTSPQNL